MTHISISYRIRLCFFFFFFHLIYRYHIRTTEIEKKKNSTHKIFLSASKFHLLLLRCAFIRSAAILHCKQCHNIWITECKNIDLFFFLSLSLSDSEHKSISEYFPLYLSDGLFYIDLHRFLSIPSKRFTIFFSTSFSHHTFE